MSNRGVLFFSTNSEHCIDIWQLLKQYSIIDTLLKINVDDPNNKIPSHINVLPSIFVRGEGIIGGKDDIIKYFNLNRNNEETSNNSNNMNNNTNTNNTNNSNNNTNNDNNTNNNNNNKALPPLGDDVPFKNQNESMFLNSNEMGSNWSDNYSFINNSSVQSHSFEMLSQKDNEKKKDRGSNKKTLLDQRMEKMMSDRNQISSINRV